ncbi:MAG: hypothetical protein M3O03_00345 [Pseudomonadota bacterium]|nr:hypothetical protein [Pseudomonadota bacterium]
MAIETGWESEKWNGKMVMMIGLARADSTRSRPSDIVSAKKQGAKKMEQRYGNFVEDGSEVMQPYADQIFGARIQGSTVQIQFRRGRDRVQISMGLRSAMHLLSILQSIHLDTGELLPPEPERAP